MGQLAIRGHKTRGEEVIKILEMLGGVNQYEIQIAKGDLLYTIRSYDKSIIGVYPTNTFVVFTLEQFLEKFPYKVGDKVQFKKATSCGFIYEIIEMEWKNDRVEYTILVVGTPYKDRRFAEDLQPYKEETMEIHEKLMPRIDFNEYCKDKYLLDLGNYEIKEEDGKTYAVRKRLEYPKTFEECCEVLNISNNGDIVYSGNWVYGGEYLEKLLAKMRSFQKLRICRDAYLKIAGEQMGLGKPWKPSKNDNVYCIFRLKGEIVKDNFVFRYVG